MGATALVAGLAIAGAHLALGDPAIVGILALTSALLLTLPMPRGRGWISACAIGLPVTLLELVTRADPAAVRNVVLAFAGSYAAVWLRATLADRSP